VRDVACTYEWRPPDASAVADAAALQALAPEVLARSVAPMPRCKAPVLPPGAITAARFAEGDGGDGAPTGVVGCDVCGRVANDRLFVILPPDAVRYKRIIVNATKDRAFVFDVAPPSADAQVFTADLPPPPEGIEYRDGRVIHIDAF
jgi:hypothetical protein